MLLGESSTGDVPTQSFLQQQQQHTKQTNKTGTTSFQSSQDCATCRGGKNTSSWKGWGSRRVTSYSNNGATLVNLLLRVLKLIVIRSWTFHYNYNYHHHHSSTERVGPKYSQLRFLQHPPIYPLYQRDKLDCTMAIYRIQHPLLPWRLQR